MPFSRSNYVQSPFCASFPAVGRKGTIMKVFYDPNSGYHRVMKPRSQKTPTGYLVWLADFYDNYQDSCQTIEVSEQVYFCMMSAYWEEKRFLASVDRHHVPLSFDETLMGELWNAASDATDELCFARLESEALADALTRIDPVLARRVYLRYIMEMSLQEIAGMENVTTAAICTSLQRAITALRKVLCKSDNQSPYT